MLFKGSFEDYIYIIIGLIWIVFSIYKGAQKNKARKQTPVSPESEPEEKEPSSIFDSFLGKLMKEEEEVPYEAVELQPKTDESIQVAHAESDKIFSYDDLVEDSNYLNKTDVYEDKAVTKSTLNQELKTHLKQSKTKPRFDLRKAVIYSEILNRRYF